MRVDLIRLCSGRNCIVHVRDNSETALAFLFSPVLAEDMRALEELLHLIISRKMRVEVTGSLELVRNYFLQRRHISSWRYILKTVRKT